MWFMTHSNVTADNDSEGTRDSLRRVMKWLIHTCDMTHAYEWHDLRVWRDTFVCGTWRIRICYMTRSYVWHDSLQRDCIPRPLKKICGFVWCFMVHVYVYTVHSHVGHDLFLYTCICIYIYMNLWFLAFGNESWCSRGAFLCVTWLIEHCGFLWCFMVYFHVWRDSFLTLHIEFLAVFHAFLCVTWLIPMCDVAHSYVWRDSFLCVAWRIAMCDMTHPYVWYDSFLCVKRCIHVCDMTHSYVWLDSSVCVWHTSFLCVTWYIPLCLSDSFLRVTWLIPTCDMTHS